MEVDSDKKEPVEEKKGDDKGDDSMDTTENKEASGANNEATPASKEPPKMEKRKKIVSR